jgi:hypothetical protein
MAADGSDNDQTRSFTALTAGTRVSHSTILSHIGAGGIGEVYLAEDTELDRKVALRSLFSYLITPVDSSPGSTGDIEVVINWKAEGQGK